jgi:SAM-dependent methyltransferase
MGGVGDGDGGGGGGGGVGVVRTTGGGGCGDGAGVGAGFLWQAPMTVSKAVVTSSAATRRDPIDMRVSSEWQLIDRSVNLSTKSRASRLESVPMERMLEATAAAEERHFWFRALRRQSRALLTTALAGRAPRLIVDCGAGTGRNLEWLREFGPAVGIELSPTGLAAGRAHGRPMVRGTITQLPLADATADVATSFDVLYALDHTDADRAVREMWRVLRPNGVVVINVAALDILRGSHSVLTQEQQRFSRHSLTALVVAAGFRVERLTFSHMSSFPVALAVRAAERLTGRAGTASDADLRVPPAPVNAIFDVLLQLEAAWLRVGNLPIGSSLLMVARKAP